MMHHIVNFGLLFSFTTLAISGLLSYFQPFSTVTTRVHLVFGALTLVLVGCHLATRIPYFRRMLSPQKQRPTSLGWVLSVATGWAILLVLSISGWQPTQQLLKQSYEARQRAAIVRSSPLTGFQASKNELNLVREPSSDADTSVSLIVRLNTELSETPAIAVWAENSSGSMIETIYLNQAISYSDTPKWADEPTPRNHILPIWRHRYTLVSGIDHLGQVDTISGATKSHQFTLDKYLVRGEEQSFVLCVEVNLPGDPNEAFPDPRLGQPSILYTAFVNPDTSPQWALLELTGHGGGAEENGAIQYDLERLTSAKRIVDVVLAKTQVHQP